MFSLLDRITDFSVAEKSILLTYRVDYSRIKSEGKGGGNYLFTKISNLNYIVSKKSCILFFFFFQIIVSIFLYIFNM